MAIEMNTVKRIIENTKGKIFRISFIKRSNGKRRDMVCRLHVKKNIKGTGLPYNRSINNLYVVYEMKKGYRAIPLDSVIEIKSKKRLVR